MLSVESFFSRYMFHPFSEELSITDRVIATIFSAAVAILSLGIVHGVCFVAFYDRQFSILSVEEQEEEALAPMDSLEIGSTDPIGEQEEAAFVPVALPNTSVRELFSGAFTTFLSQPARELAQFLSQDDPYTPSPEISFTLACCTMTFLVPETVVLGALATVGYEYYRNRQISVIEEGKIVTVFPTTMAITGAVAASLQWTIVGKKAGLIGRCVFKTLPFIATVCVIPAFKRVYVFVKNRLF